MGFVQFPDLRQQPSFAHRLDIHRHHSERCGERVGGRRSQTVQGNEM